MSRMIIFFLNISKFRFGERITLIKYKGMSLGLSNIYKDTYKLFINEKTQESNLSYGNILAKDRVNDSIPFT